MLTSVALNANVVPAHVETLPVDLKEKHHVAQSLVPLCKNQGRHGWKC